METLSRMERLDRLEHWLKSDDSLILRDAAEVRPMLWRYEASALLSNMRAHVEEPAIVRIDIRYRDLIQVRRL